MDRLTGKETTDTSILSSSRQNVGNTGSKNIMNNGRPTTGTRTRYWPNHEKEKRERYIDIFVRSLLEMIRQQPGIRQVDLRSMYTRREQVLVDEALLRLRSDYRVIWKEDGNSPRLFLGKPGAGHREEKGRRKAP